jgi:WD40 repeat protein/uncharacterized caspase-like protein
MRRRFLVILSFALLAIPGRLDAQSTPGPQPRPTQQPQLVMPVGETELINSAAFSPDGKRMIVTSTRDVKLWETATGMQLMEMADTDQTWQPPSFSPDGKYILVPRVGTIDVWDAVDGYRVNSISDSLRLLASASFSPDGRLILAGWQNGKLSIYQTQTGKLLRSWQVVPAPSTADQYTMFTPVLYTAFFSPDGKKIFYTGGGALHIIDGATGSPLVQLASPAYESLPYAHFEYSPDGKKLIGYQGADTTGKVWNATDGHLLFSFGDPQHLVLAMHFSPDGTRLLTLSDSGVLRILSMPDGHGLITRSRDSSRIVTAEYSPDGKTIITAHENGTVALLDAHTGAITRSLPPQHDVVYSSVFNRAEQLLATISNNLTIHIWDLRNGKTLSVLKGHAPMLAQALYSPDKKTIHALTDRGDYLWNPATGRLIGRDSIRGMATTRCWDPAGERLVTTMADNIATIWSVRTGQALTTLRGHTSMVLSASFSADGTRVVTASADGTARIWDASSGACLITLKGDTGYVNDAAFSPDGTLVATGSEDFKVKVWSATTGNLLLDLRKHVYDVRTVEFSPDGSTLLSSSFDGTAKLWDPKTGDLLQDFGAQQHSITSARYSPDGSMIFLAAEKGAALWHVADKRLQTLDLRRSISFPGMSILSSEFSSDGKKLVIADWDTLYVYDALSGQRLTASHLPYGMVQSAQFGEDTRTILTNHLDNTFNILDTRTGRLLYNAVAVDSADYLIYDEYGRYDGSDGAKKLLYFTCGTEIISLDQVKEQLWVPNLAVRLLAGESINASRLSDLPICGLIPVVETKAADSTAWHFIIHPRSGGLGSVVVSVNGNETRRYSPAQLPHTANGYMLTIPKKELADLLVPGQDNPVTVKAFTAEGELASRGAIVSSAIDMTHHPAPNLYAVMVGISDYKGKSLHLRYAAKDANDLSLAIGTAARSWLNQDGKEHVFMYNLTTDRDHYLLPEKAAIRQTFEAIAKKAQAADILLIFFAGHGVMAGDAKKHFYFLTADASDANSGPAVAAVGISTQELADWIHPSKIRAQKRILILDACNSGQVINDLVTIGTKDHSYGAARNDDNAEQIRSIDKLNERSGLFILAASASDQSAYELSRYSHGLLTYALLKAIREDPSILDATRYLNVSPWFDHAERTVAALARDIGGRQEPQLVSTTSFDIGIVDSSVIASIGLKDDHTPAFSTGSFLNKDENVGGDNLQLTTAVGQQLQTLAARGGNGNGSNGNGAAASTSTGTSTGNNAGTGTAADEIDYTPSDMAGTWSLYGFYTVTGNQVTLNVNIWRDNQNLYHYRVTGTTGDIKGLAAVIIRQALAWITANKPKQ